MFKAPVNISSWLAVASVLNLVKNNVISVNPITLPSCTEQIQEGMQFVPCETGDALNDSLSMRTAFFYLLSCPAVWWIAQAVVIDQFPSTVVGVEWRFIWANGFILTGYTTASQSLLVRSAVIVYSGTSYYCDESVDTLCNVWCRSQE